MTEADHGKKDILPPDVLARTDTARGVLGEAFHTTIPLQKLGYTYRQIEQIAPIIESVVEGANIEPIKLSRNIDSTDAVVSYIPHLGLGVLLFLESEVFCFTAQLEESVKKDPKAPVDLYLYGIKKPEEDYTAEELASYIEPQRQMKKAIQILSRIPFMGGIRSIQSAYYPFYLDPNTRNNLALYSPNKAEVYTRIASTNTTPVPFDIWGWRQNIEHEEVVKAHEKQKQRAPRSQVIFSPRPSFG